MAKALDSEILTSVGAGTLVGDLMREYWIPAALSSELKADGDPMRLMLLGEKLVAFRDSEWPGWHFRPPMPAPLRLAVLRPEPGEGNTLRLPRLEV